MGRILQRYCDEVRVIWSDYDLSMKYWFWDVPLPDGVWLASKEFIVTDVLEGDLRAGPELHLTPSSIRPLI
jgi:hypothetical protein